MESLYSACAHAIQIKLNRITFVVIKNISLVDYIMCYEIYDKV